MQNNHTTPEQRRNAGQFRKGHDPRRHQFTREECQAGFWAAIEAVIIRYPDAINARGHIALNFLPSIIARKAQKGD